MSRNKLQKGGLLFLVVFFLVLIVGGKVVVVGVFLGVIGYIVKMRLEVIEKRSKRGKQSDMIRKKCC